ncbi:MAG: DUF922 domain-containing protein [Chitinophagaceae bacterium]|nr:MAG: DUF922 domain-containing protein [Chitinophagaceae bacterium]
MKIFHLLPLLMLTINYSGTPAPVKPQAFAAVRAGTPNNMVYNEDEMIPWRNQRKLSWDDFLSSPQKQGDAVASTSTSLGISYQVKNGELTYTITCNFSRKKSWGLLRTDYILAHEQAHFDITELHARKLYKALYHYEFNPDTFKKDIAAIYEKIVDQKEEMQQDYDRETDHSRRKITQNNWLEKIDSMLGETEPFSAYP